jgi:hypothetical protein
MNYGGILWKEHELYPVVSWAELYRTFLVEADRATNLENGGGLFIFATAVLGE